MQKKNQLKVMNRLTKVGKIKNGRKEGREHRMAYAKICLQLGFFLCLSSFPIPSYSCCP